MSAINSCSSGADGPVQQSDLSMREERINEMYYFAGDMLSRLTAIADRVYGPLEPIDPSSEDKAFVNGCLGSMDMQLDNLQEALHKANSQISRLQNL
jgi:hypothetical protein